MMFYFMDKAVKSCFDLYNYFCEIFLRWHTKKNILNNLFQSPIPKIPERNYEDFLTRPFNKNFTHSEFLLPLREIVARKSRLINYDDFKYQVDQYQEWITILEKEVSLHNVFAKNVLFWICQMLFGPKQEMVVIAEVIDKLNNIIDDSEEFLGLKKFDF